MDAHKKTLGPYNRYEEEIYAKEKGVFIVKRREKGGA